MERLVFFGKGGIGKSTTATNFSATLAMQGQRVLHVGCDPKHDSTVALLGGRMIEAVTDKPLRENATADDVVVRSKVGVDCVEAGGPAAGVGCGGRAITRMLEVFRMADLLNEARYDTVVFDVLGDVVCGGFAAPLKKDVGHKVVIVASEEVMSLYAANNIARAVVNYGSNGIVLAGIIMNLRDNEVDRAPMERFAKLLSTRIIGWVPRDATIREAEYRRTTAVEMAPASPIARVFRDLADRVLSIDADTLPVPTPIAEASFYEYTRHRFAEPPDGSGRIVAEAPAPVSAPLTSNAPEVVEASDDFRYELSAGLRAVREGLLDPSDALDRLREAFPGRARELRLSDMVA